MDSIKLPVYGMIDLHTHLLPDWDDGAEDWEETLTMAKAAEEDGITKICLTPHLYRLTKHGDDLELLEQRMAEIERWEGRFQVEFFRGAEVYIDDQIVENIKKNNLTINNSSYIFVEFPVDNVTERVKDLFYRIMLEGYIPIISHPERNIIFATRPKLLFELVGMGALAQVTAKSILGEFGSGVKQSAEFFLKHNLVHLIASDAHDRENRPPLLKSAVERTMKIVGEKKALAMVAEIPQAILDNRAIPEFGDPINPPKKQWRFRF